MEKPQPAYRPELFVNHVEEIALVTQAAQDAAARKAKRTRAITFYGERGSGKTWLVRQLGATLPTQLAAAPHAAAVPPTHIQVLTLFLAPPKVEVDKHAQRESSDCLFFQAPSPSAPRSAAEIVEQFLRWVCAQWGVMHDDNASASDLVYWLGRDLPRRADTAYVLLVDSVFEFGKGNERLPLLEDLLLAPIATLENGLVVMTGRGAPFPWRSVPLRHEHREVVLPPFRAPDVGEQLTRCAVTTNPAHTARVHQLGGGYPLNNYVLGQSDPPEAGLGELVNVLLDFVERDNLSVREALEALCVLDSFREREIATMVAQRRAHTGTTELPMEEARRVRDLLLENYLIRWSVDGYSINESVRVAYRSFLRYHEPSVYAAMVDHAITTYQTWSERYPNARDHYRRQAAQLALLPAPDGVPAPNTTR